EELQMLRQEKITGEIAGSYVKKDLSMYELELFVTGGFEIRIAEDLAISYDPVSRKVVLSLHGRLAAGRTLRAVLVDKMEKIHLLVDNSILEIFINEGEKVMTTRFYPNESVHEMMIKADNGKFNLWRLNKMEFQKGSIY
ncbi:GH32 C-terminal domain-containing protein, partial [Clostridioides difficile]|uniref:GH32 C-terminal domain-containing protein n=1 Tax=Clostridioides difficile TaxID=1496 RepID=UPI00235A37C1